MTNGFIVFPVVLSCCVSLRRSSATPLLALDMFQLFWPSKSETWLFWSFGVKPKERTNHEISYQQTRKRKKQTKKNYIPF